jgi:hypothetical protein
MHKIDRAAMGNSTQSCHASFLRVEFRGEAGRADEIAKNDRNRTALGRNFSPFGVEGFGAEAMELVAGVPPAKAAIAAKSLRRSPTAATSMSLRSSAVSCGSMAASTLLSRKIRLVLFEAETAKPPADFHGRAPHGFQG